MKKGKRYLSLLLPGALFLLLIIDSETAAKGAAAGITQCIQVIIPSLFPFFFVSCWFNSMLQGLPLPIVSVIGKILRLPSECASILLIGLLGGYPVGAKTINDAYNNNLITKQTAHILLGYCNNAGPAFIFGISHILFLSNRIPWIIWGIQIISVIITALLLPRPTEAGFINQQTRHITLTTALENSLSVTSIVCGWILLFKVLLQYLEQITFLHSILPMAAGVLELSNGSILLTNIFPSSLRFLLFSVILSFGGLCVYLQTLSAVATIGTGLYLHGKGIQSAVCILISIPFSFLIFKESPLPIPILLPVILVCIAVILILSTKCRKKCGNYDHNRV